MKLFGWLRGARRDGEPAPPARDVADVNEDEIADARFAALSAFWSSIGDLESDVLAPLINPAFMGGAAWPSGRTAFRVIRRSGSLILATDGLSACFLSSDGQWSSLGMELFIETASIPAELAGGPGEISRLSQSWAMTLLWQAADLVANNGGILPTLDRLSVISTEFPGASGAPVMSQLPPGFITENDCLGALFGEPAPDFPVDVPDLPGPSVRLVPLVLLRADELASARNGGAEGRRKIADALAASPSGHRSDLDRSSVA